MNAKALKVWMLQNDVKSENLAVMLKISFYTVRKMLRGEKVNDSLIELLSIKTGIPTDVLLLQSPDVSPDVASVKEG